MKRWIRLLVKLLATVGAVGGLLFGAHMIYDRPDSAPYCANPVESTPTAQGLDAAALEAAYQQAADIPELFSLVVVRNDLIVCEAYFQGQDIDSSRNVKSVSKGLLSALVGIALDEGLIPGLDTKISTYFPEYYLSELDDPRKADVTIRHLLTMTGGWEWVENAQVTLDWWRSDDSNEFALSLPVAQDPGTTFNYTTAGSHLLATLLAGIVPDNDLRSYADDRLFDPLGMTLTQWDQDSQGNYFGGAEMYFTPRDMAKFGILYMNGGAHGSHQVVPADWIHESTSPQVERIDPAIDPEGVWNYGYMWWLRPFAGHDTYFALGYGGQFIFCIPSLDLVIVVTSTIYNDNSHVPAVWDLVEKELIPAVLVE